MHKFRPHMPDSPVKPAKTALILHNLTMNVTRPPLKCLHFLAEALRSVCTTRGLHDPSGSPQQRTDWQSRESSACGKSFINCTVPKQYTVLQHKLRKALAHTLMHTRLLRTSMDACFSRMCALQLPCLHEGLSPINGAQSIGIPSRSRDT